MEKRNNIVDSIRGFAMLLVVLGHTMAGSTAEFQNSFLFKVIWSLQMPLFIIISGYVTRYSRPITETNEYWKFLKKRTLAYLLPWVVWTFIVRAFVFDQLNFLDIKWLFWNMDSGYWFLITIWTISMIFGLSEFLSNKITIRNRNLNIIFHLVFCGIGMVGLASIGYVLGLSFLSIKLTLYYLPIYLIGYLYGQFQDVIMKKPFSCKLIDGVITLSLVLWIAIIMRYNFYEESDSGLMILFRYITSILGCIAVIGISIKLPNSVWVDRQLKWVGEHSLEVYLSHYLFLNLFYMETKSGLMTLNGFTLMTANFLITVLLTILLIRIVQRNTTLNYILFWKKM